MSVIIPSLPIRVSRDLLPFVALPGQYIGQEINQLVAEGDWARADVRVAVAFPDTYTIGMSHLGCQIIYSLVNHVEGCCAERVFCPWLDAEAGGYLVAGAASVSFGQIAHSLPTSEFIPNRP